jgi:hypothetical protein
MLRDIALLVGGALLGLLVNLATPNVQQRWQAALDWWAERSRQSIERRLEELTRRLEGLSFLHEMVDDRAVDMLRIVGRMIAFASVSTIGMICVVIQILVPKPDARSIGTVFFIGVVAIVAIIYSYFQFGKAAFPEGEIYRLKERIAKLREKLEQSTR